VGNSLGSLFSDALNGQQRALWPWPALSETSILLDDSEWGGRILFWSQEHGLCASITLHNGRRLLLHKRLEFAQKTMANRKALIRFSSFSRGGRAVKAV